MFSTKTKNLFSNIAPTVRRMKHACRNAMALCALCLLAACAKPVLHAPSTPAPATQAAATWQAYEQYSEVMQNHYAPYRVSASLRYDSKGNGHRLLVHMWSNDGVLDTNQAQSTTAEQRLLSPLRLDIMAGIGATVAQVREDAYSFLLYSPQEKKAYYHNGSRKPLFSLGVPVPFSIADLTALIHGRFSTVFGTTFDTQNGHAPRLEPHGEIAYDLAGQNTLGEQGQLIMSEDGLVLQWSEQATSYTDKKNKRGWYLDIAYADPQNSDTISKINPVHLPLPRKLTFTYYGTKGVEHTAIILIKERHNPAQAFAPEQIELEIPEGTAFYPLQSAQ